MSSTQQLLLGEGAGGAAPVYVEEVFSTWLYSGNGSTQTITNGIDLSTNGGLVWIKNRTAYSHALFDTSRGVENLIKSNTTEAQSNLSGSLTSFTTSGFSLGSAGIVNDGSGSYPNNVSWTFREQPKFFDVVTYTGNGQDNRQIAHNLGSAPGCIMVKKTNTTGQWFVYHRGLNNGVNAAQYYLNLETTNAQAQYEVWENTNPTSTVFTIDSFSGVNGSGDTYVAYLFAHDAGGFGLTGTDNVISCGSFTPDAFGNATVNLGYEPQWILYKGASGAGGTDSWVILDTMRGWDLTASDKRLFPNTSGAENTSSCGYPTATGFEVENLSASPYIYIAIRRGPMKVPTSGTSVFSPVTTSGTGTNNRVITGLGFSPDMIINCTRGSSALDRYTQDRLRGVKPTIYTNSTSAEQATQGIYAVGTLDMSGFTLGTSSGVGFNSASDTYVFQCFKRAPNFFDEVCYTGTGSAQNVTHNLTVAPELVLIKSRSGGGSGYGWVVGSSVLPSWGRYLQLNTTDQVNPSNNAGPFNNTAPTSSVLTVNTWTETNGSGATYVAYLFATCAGVSKVGSYTGTGAIQTVNCGFAAGARFVLIKRTDSTGDWFVWDSARGISSGNDPYLLLNSAAAEVTGTNYVDTTAVGFQVTAAAPAGLNANGGTYLFLAIA